MGYRYIGSKARIADEIITYLGKPSSPEARFIDGFSGTGIVASKAADIGWQVVINDMMKNAIVMSEARLLAECDVPFIKVGGYDKALAELNALDGCEGFIWREYSPASKELCGIERKYFTEQNAKKIDAIMCKVHEWRRKGIITHREFSLLMANIITATNDVANIAGTYGCFLSKWSSAAQNPIELIPSVLRTEPVQYTAHNLDVFAIESSNKDTVYLDPPYTKRQYASYYHIHETIVCGDEPVVEGTSGLRPWKDKASVFCYKAKALDALVRLITNQKAHRVLLSYSDEGHVKLDQLKEHLSSHGTVEVIDLGSIGRYRPNKVAVENNANVCEYLIDFRHGE